ncbi:FHA domain-containing protein [Gryllotalpicola sp.]|uniref:FHA domain-containing protein n=1 Tax=Gryllotalpicola sp. TaxID=1932787 RepID=UPI002614BD0E|nr:FHA domain-containing protein [Gryllotalpicola sp.]
MPDGTRIPLASGITLVGRKPVVQQGRLGARLIRLPDATRSASKTHAALTVDPAGETLTVADLGSTNGTLLSNPAAEPVELVANQTAHVESGAVLMLGDLPVTAHRAT